MTRLIDRYDAALFDLDGVIYLGPVAVPGAAAALAQLQQDGLPVMFVTNNAGRPAEVVIEQLNQLGFRADAGNVLTSAQVAATILAAELPAGAKLMACGAPALAEVLHEVGFEVVATAAEQPVAVVQGYDPKMTWPRLDEAALAIQAGARWYATNNDSSRPTDRGLVPGVGGALAVIALTVGGEPTVFGKPFRPMLAEAERRTKASRPIFVGDRLDTDISGAVSSGMDSLLVFTGTHGKADLIAASPEGRPTHIGADVGALLLPARQVELTPQAARCASQMVSLVEQQLVLTTRPTTEAEQFDALWAATQLAWQHPDADPTAALAALDLIH